MNSFFVRPPLLSCDHKVLLVCGGWCAGGGGVRAVTQIHVPRPDVTKCSVKLQQPAAACSTQHYTAVTAAGLKVSPRPRRGRSPLAGVATARRGHSGPNLKQRNRSEQPPLLSR